MRRNRWQPTAFLVLAAWLATVGSLRAEVSADPNPIEVGVIILGIIEGPDPIPQVIWEPVRDVDPDLYLNPDGAGRGDGRPDIAIDSVTGWPHVVWAYNLGGDSDIAYSRWNGSAWLETEFLTSSAVDELDPRIFIDDEFTYVVWWEESRSAIRLLKRPRLGAWEPPELIVGNSGVRPSVVAWGATVLVVSETEDGQGGREIVLSTQLGQGSFSTELVGSIPGDVPLDVVLHYEPGRLWMDWRNSNTAFAYSEFAGEVWLPATVVPWPDQSWVKVEAARLYIRHLVLTSP